MNNSVIVNLGDTLLHKKEWEMINSPDVLMIPIGGASVHNTMNVKEALLAVSIIKPKRVIPCHYNCPGLFKKAADPTDDKYFQTAVIKLGFKCSILGVGESLQL